MKFFLQILIFILSFQSSVKSNDIRDFQIEGISVGDSALDFFSKKELKYRNEVKKFWVAASNLKKNTIVQKKDFVMKRVHNNQINNIFLEDIIKKKLKKDLEEETVIDKSFFENHTTALIIVRTKSKRLPNKCLKKIFRVIIFLTRKIRLIKSII